MAVSQSVIYGCLITLQGEELRQLKPRSICLGNYVQWDTKANVETIGRELGWFGHDVEGIPPQYHYEKVECTFQGMRDYAKYVKRGYGRTNPWPRSIFEVEG